MSNTEEIIAKIREKAGEYLPTQVELLTEFASFDSETHYVEGNRRAVDLIRKHLEPLEPQFQEFTYENVGTHLLAKLVPENPKGRLILNAHLDTVFPVGFAKENPPHREGDWLYGLGTIDCKGGVTVSCYAVRVLKDLGLLPDYEIDILYTCDEEQGSMTGQELYAKLCPGADGAFVFEPGYKQDGKIPILTSRQGVILGNMDITGVEAHAGCDYSKGHSANRELAYKILELYSFNDDKKGIYYNAAPVSGGRPNGVVSGNANLQFCVAGIPDMESWHECEKNLDKMGSHVNDPGCSLDLSYRELFPPQPRLDKTGELYDLIEKAAGFLGLETKEDGANHNGEDIYAATDANYMAKAGIPALDGFGPQGVGMHTTGEGVFIPSILEKTSLFASFLYLLSQK